jgi:hypothetical protein
MGLRAAKFQPDDPAILHRLSFRASSVAAGQANLVIGSKIPGFRFQLVSVKAWTRSGTLLTVTQVNIGATNALNAAFAPATGNADPASGTLVADLDNLRGTAANRITVAITTGADTGAATDLEVEVVVRPFPANGDAE